MTEKNVQQSLKSHIKLYRKKDLLKLRIYNCNHSKIFLVFFALPTRLFFPQLIIRNYLCILSVNLGLEFSAEFKKLGQ